MESATDDKYDLWGKNFFCKNIVKKERTVSHKLQEVKAEKQVQRNNWE